MKQFLSCMTALCLVMGLCMPTYALPPKPAKCPGVASIKAAGLNYTLEAEDGYVVLQMGRYDTLDTWAFGFTAIKATSKDAALTIGKDMLTTLSGSPKPLPLASQNIWVCVYQTADGQHGVAITPVNLSTKLNTVLLAMAN